MIKIFYFSCYLLLFLLYNTNAQGISNKNIIEDNNKMKITILYDNYIFKQGTTADWGFACLIEDSQKTILFDTGAKADILLKNIKILNVDISKINMIVISHNHWDHTGGLEAILEKNPKVKVYMPFSTPSEDKEKISKYDASVFTEKEPKEIIDGVFLTGEMGGEIREQSLILDTPKGMVIITGCSHPGIINIVKRAKEILDKKIYLVIGGFHLHRHSEEEVNKIIEEFKSLSVEQCGCSHCTGENAIDQFSKTYAENFIKIGTGKVIQIKN